jgi:hypothetical protein
MILHHLLSNLRRFLLLSVLALLLLHGGLARADEPLCGGKRRGDQFWVVSTRHLPDCGLASETAPQLHVRYYAGQSWQRGNVEQLLANEPDKTTLIYVHGNRYEDHDAIERGRLLYRAMTDCLPAEQNLRMIVWSWPSEVDGGPIRDVRKKTCRTEIEAYYLATLLARMNPETPTRLVSYSLGGRVMLGAMHLAAGGQWAGRVVNPSLPIEPRYNVALIAPGVEDDSLRPGARFQMALPMTAQMLVTYNPVDPILKRFHFVDKSERPTAMGYTGVVGLNYWDEASQRIVERNVSGIVGRSHFEVSYLGSSSIMAQVRELVMSAPPSAP